MASPPFLINNVLTWFHIGKDGDEGGIVENYSLESGPEARCTFKCGWNVRWQLIQGLLGTVNYAAGTITRTPPISYPLNSNLTIGAPNGIQIPQRWVCTSVGPVRGLKWQTDASGVITGTNLAGWGSYEWAILEAVFTVPLWQVAVQPSGSALCDISTQAYAVTKLRTSGEVFAPPTGSVIYGGGAFAGTPLQDVNASLVRGRTEMSVTLIRFPIYPGITINSLIGSVNSVPLAIGQYVFPVGSALFTGAATEPKADPCNFGIVQDVELTWLLNGPSSAFQGGGGGSSSLDWNYFMDPSGAWVPCVRNLDPPTPLFAYVDPTALFNPVIS